MITLTYAEFLGFIGAFALLFSLFTRAGSKYFLGEEN